MYNSAVNRSAIYVLLVLHCWQAVFAGLTTRNGYSFYKGHAAITAHHLPPSNTEYESEPPANLHVISDNSNISNEHHGEYVKYNSAGDDDGQTYHNAADVNHEGHKSGYSLGSGLRSIAQGSANQAYNAVASQHAAAKQAAFLAQNSLAQAASQAAATAQAALHGKQVLLHELEQQVAEAQKALTREVEQLKAAKIAAKLAQQSAQSAANHVSVLTAAINNAKSLGEIAEQTAKEVTKQLATQSAMVGQAKAYLEQVEEQLKQAGIDFAATKEATIKATSSAAEAQVNASKAAAHATIGLHESAQQQQQHIEQNNHEETYSEVSSHQIPEQSTNLNEDHHQHQHQH